MTAIGLPANDLIVFAHVVAAGSFTRAADLTGLPKATLSRRLAELETALGERLLRRITRRRARTEFGAQMLDHARRLQDESEAALALERQRGLGFVLQAARVVEHLRAELGPRAAPRDAPQEAFAERGFELGEPARKRRLGQPGEVGRAREAAGRDDVGEHDQVVGGKADGSHRRLIVSFTGRCVTLWRLYWRKRC